MKQYKVQGLTRDEIIAEMENLMSWERAYIIEYFAKEFKNNITNVAPTEYIKTRTIDDILSCYPIPTIQEWLANKTVL